MIKQEGIIKSSQEMVRAGRMPHALLLLGEMGYGTLDVALEIAASLLGSTEALKEKAHRLTHPDLHFAFPVMTKGTKKRADTTSKDFLEEWRDIVGQNRYFGETEWAAHIGAAGKQLNINTTECNEIIKKLSLKAFEGQNKVLIVYLAEYLAKEGNRLLKLIEEPTPDSFILLLAESPDRILNTVLSRCQILKIPPYKDEEVISFLETEQNLDNEKAQEITYLSRGNLQNAVKLLANDGLSSLLIDWLRKAYMMQKKPGELFSWINNFAKLEKTKQRNFISYSLHFLREFYLFESNTGAQLRLTAEEKAIAQNLTKIIDSDKVGKLSQILDNLYYHLERNANLKVELTAVSIEICTLLRQRKMVGN